MAKNNKIKVIIEADSKRYEVAVDKVTGKTKRLGKDFKKSAGQMQHFAGTLKLAGAVMAGIGVAKFAGEWLRVNREFESLNASLITVTGSAENADTAFAWIEKFATETPYQLSEVVKGFTKLTALGLEPSADALRSYGNVASGMGKSLDQFIEAVADASVAEFERLKEFGIKSKNQGDTIQFTFRGASTSVKNSADEITAYLQNLGDVEFAGGMARQMDTLDGKISNLGDSWEKLLRKLGDSGATGYAIESLTDAFEFWGNVINDTSEKINPLYQELDKLTDSLQEQFAILEDLKNNSTLGVIFGIQGTQVDNQTKKIKALGEQIKRLYATIQEEDKGDSAIFKVEKEIEQSYARSEVLEKQEDVRAKAITQITKANEKIKTDFIYTEIEKRRVALNANFEKQREMAASNNAIESQEYQNYLSNYKLAHQQLADDEVRINLEAQQKKLEAAKDWRSGVTRATQDYYESAADYATQYENLTTSAFQGMEDALVKFVTTGKLSFKDLANSIVADLVRIYIKQQMVSMLGGGLGGIFGSLFGGGSSTGSIVPSGGVNGGYWDMAHTGGVAGSATMKSAYLPASIFDGAPRYHTGGVAGLASDEVPTILQRGEGVFTAKQMQALAPVSTTNNSTKGDTIINVTYAPNLSSLDPSTAAQVIAENAPLITGIIRESMSRAGQEAQF